MTAPTTSGAAAELAVYLDGRRVGTLTSPAPGGAPGTFTYDRDVLGDQTAAVSVRLPVRADPYQDHEALPCFENLLPDGDLRDLLAASVHRASTDVVGLLGVFGGECAGALSLWPAGLTPPATPTYRPCTAVEVRAAFAPSALAGPQDRAQPRRPDDAGGMVSAGLPGVLARARMSMSGAQEKLVLYRRPQTGSAPHGDAPEYRLPVAGAPSTVLVKRERARFPGLLHNELACMTMMASAGVPTAGHTVCALDAGVYETARFDRVCRPDGSVVRLHAEDGCQLTGKPPSAKYAQTGGPTYADLTAALRRHGTDPGTDTPVLFRWAVANLALGNRDAHAKNISVLRTEDGALRLAPAYDVVCTMAYTDLDTVLPLLFAGVTHVAQLTPAALTKAARSFGLTPALAKDLVADVCDRLDAHRDDALQEAERVAGPHEVLASVGFVVEATTAETRRRLLG
ncbi:MAG: HipA domain-containing protein [Gemmatimonadetes bacterium]|nr:HipA domain-containing protein [Gemmatimonadota bacterium]